MYKSTVSKFLSGIVFILTVALIIQSCKPEAESEITVTGTPDGQAVEKTIISGQVINELDGVPVGGATVVIDLKRIRYF
jgi:hypothetical protein